MRALRAGGRLSQALALDAERSAGCAPSLRARRLPPRGRAAAREFRQEARRRNLGARAVAHVRLRRLHVLQAGGASTTPALVGWQLRGDRAIIAVAPRSRSAAMVFCSSA